MFISKDDLKPKAKAKAKGTVNIVEQAKVEREEREVLRRKTKCAVQIQAIYRSYLYRYRFKGQLRRDFDKKIGDIRKLSQVLKISRNIIFAAPGDICLQLSRLLCYGKFSGREVSS